MLINCLRYYLRRPETDEDSYWSLCCPAFQGLQIRKLWTLPCVSFLEVPCTWNPPCSKQKVVPLFPKCVKQLGASGLGFSGCYPIRFWLWWVTLECKVLGYDVCCDGIMEHCQITGTSFGSCFLSDVFSATNCGHYWKNCICADHWRNWIKQECSVLQLCI